MLLAGREDSQLSTDAKSRNKLFVKKQGLLPGSHAPSFNGLQEERPVSSVTKVYYRLFFVPLSHKLSVSSPVKWERGPC